MKKSAQQINPYYLLLAKQIEQEEETFSFSEKEESERQVRSFIMDNVVGERHFRKLV